jgi:predicted transposase YbfD/YdcC
LAVKCHFLAQLKRNARKLWETVALYTALGNPISTCEYYEQEHGRQVYRRIELYVNDASLPKGWNGITRFVKVRRWGIRKGKPFEERTFYILSKPINSAFVVAQAIQAHWTIENNLHWCKDVNLGEDDMSVSNTNAISLLVYLNNIACNTLKQAGYKPVKNTFAKFANKVNELIKLFQKET